ncbi:MAG TPA: 50S ribosomal protein L22 [Candidatus Polarisedimenticolaceae bacterium]|nr:50S ribosomal protein L22 [Candidatus Polarisedimenticolaceae bacterium]
MIATAKLKYLGVSSQKTRLVVDQVRGRNVGEALAILHYSPKLVARDLEKLVKSAVANAQQSDPNVDVDQLVIARAMVDEAPSMKRARAQSMGRIFRVLKRACHVTIDLDLSGKSHGH